MYWCLCISRCRDGRSEKKISCDGTICGGSGERIGSSRSIGRSNGNSSSSGGSRSSTFVLNMPSLIILSLGGEKENNMRMRKRKRKRRREQKRNKEEVKVRIHQRG